MAQILQQNTNQYIINTVLATHTTPTGIADPNNASIDGYNVFGINDVAGTIDLLDGASGNNSAFRGPIPYGLISYTNPPVYKAATAETPGVVYYQENATLLPSTLYSFTITQFNPYTTGTGQLVTATVQYVTPANPATPAHGSVAAGLASVLALIPGFNLTLTFTTVVNTNDNLVITANAGYPIVYITNRDSYGIVTQHTAGVMSSGYPADMLANGYNTLPNYSSGNNYDTLTVNYSRNINGIIQPCQSIAFINHADSHAAAQAAYLGGATSVFAGYFNYYSVINTTFSSTEGSKQ